MTPIGPVSAGSDAIVEHKLERSYPFTLLPAQKVQSFTTPAIVLIPPFVRFTQGATLESNKLYEAAIEQADNLNNIITPLGPGGLTGIFNVNYKTSFDCHISAIVTTPANLSDAVGFIGIELFSQGLTTLIDTPVNSSIQLKWQLKDPTQWMLSVYRGNGLTGIHRPFSTSSSQVAGGHKVRLFWDPFEKTVLAYVDDILVVKQSIAGFTFQVADTNAGILLYNGGNITASPSIIGYWMGAKITTYDMHTSGAGFLIN